MKSHTDLSPEQVKLKGLIFKKCQIAKFSSDALKPPKLVELSSDVLHFLNSIKEISDEDKVYFFLLQIVSFKEPLIQQIAIGLLKNNFPHVLPLQIFQKAKNDKEINLSQWMLDVIAKDAYRVFEGKLAEISKQFTQQFDKKAKLQLEHLHKLLTTLRTPIEMNANKSKELKEHFQNPAAISTKESAYLRLFKTLHQRAAITEVDFLKKSENGLLAVMNHYRNKLISVLKTPISARLQLDKTKTVKLALKEKAHALGKLIKLNNLLQISPIDRTPTLISIEKIRRLAGYHHDQINLGIFLEHEKPLISSKPDSKRQAIAHRH